MTIAEVADDMRESQKSINKDPRNLAVMNHITILAGRVAQLETEMKSVISTMVEQAQPARPVSMFTTSEKQNIANSSFQPAPEKENEEQRKIESYIEKQVGEVTSKKIDEIVIVIEKSNKNTDTKFSKLQDYINNQTEYMNEVMSSKDDVLENLGTNLASLMDKFKE